MKILIFVIKYKILIYTKAAQAATRADAQPQTLVVSASMNGSSRVQAVTKQIGNL